jgi:hypothetical protein
VDEGGSPHLPLSIHGVQPALVRCRPVLRHEAVPPVLERSRRGRARGVAHQGPELGLRSRRAAEVLLDALLHVRRAEAVVGHPEHHPGLLVVEMWAFFLFGKFKWQTIGDGHFFYLANLLSSCQNSKYGK